MELCISKNDKDLSSQQDWLKSGNFTQWCSESLASGIEVEFVQQVIRAFNIQPNEAALVLENWPWPVKIHTLGHFSVELDGQPLTFEGKAQKKPLELLKALLAHGGQHINMETLSETLWPDTEGDDAFQALTTTLHRLRKLIGQDVIIRQQGQLSLSPEHCWTDLRSFEYFLTSANNALVHGHLEDAWQATNKALHLYKGVFLASDSISHWVLSMRERVRRKLLHHINTMGKRLIEKKAYEQAMECYLKGLDIDDLQEIFYRGLIICHKQLEQHTEALSVYKQCHTMLTNVLDIQPSAETQALIK